MSARDEFLTFQTATLDERQAAREFYDAVFQPEPALVVFFCSSEYDLDVLADELSRLFAGVKVVGCTTAGTIGPAGYLRHGLSGVSFPAHRCRVATGLVGCLQQFDIPAGYAFAKSLLQQIPDADGGSNRFAFMLIDGLSMREELVSHAFQLALDKVPLAGGSASDDMKFSKTFVYYDGRFHSESAILVVVNTSLPFRVFRTQHFIPTDKRFVVTEADKSKRLVKEIDAMPAAEAYARMLSVEVSALTPALYAAWPAVVVINGADYVRSIQKVNPDGSLTFFCAIEQGLVLRIARGETLEKKLEQTFDNISAEIGGSQLVLGFDCILRAMEIDRTGIRDQIGGIFQRHNTVGFNTYGEQFLGVHVTQTFVGISIGHAGEAQDD